MCLIDPEASSQRVPWGSAKMRGRLAIVGSSSIEVDSRHAATTDCIRRDTNSFVIIPRPVGVAQESTAKHSSYDQSSCTMHETQSTMHDRIE